MPKFIDLEKRLSAVEQRNARVSADKAWEVSLVRRLSIAMLTYAVVASYLHVIHNSSPWVNAVVPVVGYLLSTLVLAEIKSAWIRNGLRGNKKDPQ